MIKVYFENKVIIFNNTSEIKCDNFVTFNCEDTYTVPKREEFLALLDGYNGALIVSESPKETLKIFSKDYKEVTAAGGVVTNSEDKILMIYRHNRWDLPKGKIEKGEYIEDCAVREVTEECSIEPLTLQDKICSTFHIYFFKEKWIIKESHWYKMHYTGTQIPQPQVEEDITKAEWVNRCEIEERLKNSYFTIIDIFQEYNKIQKN
ncbi:MAG: NUDIX domain-containing protein [Rikenellaceae bacterium]